MFRTPSQEILICFVPLKMIFQNVSYPLFRPKPNMFRTPQFCNNPDICFVPPSQIYKVTLIYPPHNLLEQSDLFGTPIPFPTGTGCHNILGWHVPVCLTVGVMQNDFRILNITSRNN